MGNVGFLDHQPLSVGLYLIGAHHSFRRQAGSSLVRDYPPAFLASALALLDHAFGSEQFLSSEQAILICLGEGFLSAFDVRFGNVDCNADGDFAGFDGD